MGVTDFNNMELDAIGEIMNISLGASATAVSTMLGAKVNITTPVVQVLNNEEFEFKRLEPAVGVEISYTKGLNGNNIMIFRRNDVRIIVGMLMGTEIPEGDFELNEINVSAICEVMNQMMGSSATALSEFLGNPVNISTPVSFPVESEAGFKEKYFPSDTKMVIVRFSLEIEGRLKSEFLNIMTCDLAKHLLKPFKISLEEQTKEETEVTGEEEEPKAPAEHSVQPVQSQSAQKAEERKAQPSAARPVTPPQTDQTSSEPLLQLLAQMQQSQIQMMELLRDMKVKGKQGRENILIQPMNSVALEDDAEEGTGERANREMLMKVPLELSVEVGRTKKLVKDILELTQGSLVVLDKMAGEQADLFVNGQCVAKGDIVVVEDNFGIRITEIVTRDLNPEIL